MSRSKLIPAIAGAITVAVVGLLSACEPLPDPSVEYSIAKNAATFINAERTQRGLKPIPWSYEEQVASQMQGACGDPMQGLDGHFAVATCVTPGTAGRAVYALMHSKGHNRILMKQNATALKIGVWCNPSSGRLHLGAWLIDPIVFPFDGDPSAPYSPPVTPPNAGKGCS